MKPASSVSQKQNMSIVQEEFDNTTFVSVIIPTFNRRNWIGECLDSVLSQTYPHIEVLVVDDCSTDGTVEWIMEQERYRSAKVHRQAENGGASIARNTGVELASGGLIVFIDSDDMLMPDHIEKAVAAFERDPDLGLFCCDSKMIDVDGNEILGGKTWHAHLSQVKNYPVRSGIRSLEDVFTFSNCFPGFTVRREVFQELGGFDQTLFPADDYDLALRVAGSRFKVFYLNESLCLRREHDGQCSGIQNSSKTQIKLIEALKKAASRNALSGSRVHRRLGEVGLELGMSRIKEGYTMSGARTILAYLATSPREVGTLARIIARKISPRKSPSLDNRMLA